MNRKILILIMISMIFISGFAPSFVSAQNVNTTIIASDIGTTSETQLELYVYQADDADANYDYYLIKAVVVDLRFASDAWVIPMFGKLAFFFDNTDFDFLYDFQTPDEGWIFWQTSVSLSFYGATVKSLIPMSTVDIVTSADNYIMWTVDGRYLAMPSAIMGQKAEYTIGIRVAEGAGIGEIRCDGLIYWYRIVIPYIYYTFVDVGYFDATELADIGDIIGD